MLKRTFLAVLLFTLFLVKVNGSFAYTGNGFIWNKTEITIPINSNFLDYIDEFEVKFYYKGEIQSDEVKVEVDDFYYGDLTISTSEPVTKTVKLIATVSGYSSFDKKDILVHVEDKELPTVKILEPLLFTVGEIINYENYFLFEDNHKVLSGIVNDSKVNYGVVGEYEITVTVTDVSGNVFQTKYEISIVDKQKPTINTAAFIEVSYADINFDITKHVEAHDELDGDITSNVKIKGLDVYKLGDQIVEIYVSDSSGNITSVIKTITVVDDTPPILELFVYFDTIDMKEKNIDFKKYISRVYDECEELSLDDVEIDATDFNYNFGSHKILYKVKDNSNNYSTRTLTINITYSDKPVIEASNLKFKKDEIFNLRDYINVYDLYDTDLKNNYSIYDSNIDVSTAGEYEVIIEATNMAGNTTTKTIIITIEDDIKEHEAILNNLYDFIYNNKLKVGIGIITFTCLIYYFVRKQKINKKGE